ncbi:hypothetical protein [Lactococcus garvieae]|uniref:Baseplate upper protein immunoglobulin like domain-containing protein n=1 Tax=Lactococcus garvieae TaxID=1363 RepID=A0A1I4J3G2_9LACT|nr:hypothetical protein [Lactococcus garvieae]SFL60743.1 hypothetical protein SAMN05216438_1275 [Lactococcus garvieae]
MGADGNKEYRDFEHISSDESIYDEIQRGIKTESAIKLSQWIREKGWGVDVRESLALFVEWLDIRVNDVLKNFKNLIGRQNNVEGRQTELENNFKNVIANATKDSEVITARSSEYFGDFAVLNERLENIEKILTGYVPQGVLITIKRKMNTIPENVYITTYDYGLGIVPLGTEPEGKFGGTVPIIKECKIVSWESDLLKLRVPLDYANFKFSQRPLDDVYLLLDGTHCSQIHVDGGEPIGLPTDNEQIIVEKIQPQNTQKDIVSRLNAIEDKMEGLV